MRAARAAGMHVALEGDVERALEGDVERALVLGHEDSAAVDRAFAALVAAMIPRLRTRARQLCRDRLHPDPDDLVQDALVRALRSRSTVRDHARARAWLWSILTNAFIDAVRAQRIRMHQVTLEVAEVACAGEEVVEASPSQQIDAEDLRAAIDRLPQDVRETYRLFALERKDYLSIAAAQQIPMGTVATRLRRARGHLRRLLLAALASAQGRGGPECSGSGPASAFADGELASCDRSIGQRQREATHHRVTPGSAPAARPASAAVDSLPERCPQPRIACR